MLSVREAGSYIRFRVTLVAATAALVATTIGSVLFVLSLHRSLEAGLVSTARQEVAAIRAQLANGASPQQVVITGRDDVVVQLVAGDGTVIASDHQATLAQPLLPFPGVAQDLDVPGQRDHYTVVAQRITEDDQVRVVVVARSTEQTDRARDATALLLAFSVPVVVALLAAIVWVSVGRALRPVEAMRREADAITSAHLDRRLALPPGDDEIPRLAATLNEMLDRIDLSHRLQRQFVSDASHELRSPLAVIRQSAEVARAYPDRVEVAGLADDVLAESQRLETLVTALLLLARLDDAAGPVADDLVDVDDLVLAEVTRTGRSGPDVPVDVSQVSGGQVRGSEILLAQVVRNLVDNARRHAESQVWVQLTERDGWVEMFVDDDGAGVPAEQREHVFERFVRLDVSRAREAGGAGLGLAIVRTIAERSGGSVELGSAPAGGARFSVRLPAAD
ncbi:MAG: HAMP domain-containing sensor histidine kinase [Nocardioidaceae bacterium]